MRSVAVWDPLVRVFHWGTAALFLANFFVLDEDSAAHSYAGYVLFGLVLVRLAWGLIGTKYARFSAFWPSIAAIKAHFRDLMGDGDELHLSHNPLGAVMIFNLLAALVLISVTGLMLESDAFWGVDWVETAHEILSNYTMFCVGLHIAGALFETRRSGVNLIKAMVTGRKDIPEQTH